MSLITRCPACSTMFRVVQDQLRISDGWVRCGHCTEVFDASLHLQAQAVFAEPPLAQPPISDSAPVSEPPVFPEPMPAPTQAFEEAPEQAFAYAPEQRLEQQPEQGLDFLPAPVSALSFTPSYPAPEFESVSPAALTPSPLAWGTTRLTEAAQHSLADDAGTVERAMAEMLHGPAAAQADALTQQEVIATPIERPALPDDAEPMQPLAASAPAPAPAPTAAAEAVEEPTESTIEDMSFVREARRKAFWRRPGVRVAMAVVCVLLVAALALQVAVQERDRLAVLEPRAKPWLEELCGPLQCTVKPLRQIESIVIESSAFNKVRGNAYRFSVSLRNKSAVPLAMPGIELALTDSQDQPMLRRVLLPADLGAAAVLAPGAEWSASLPVSVAPTTQTSRIAGYRLLAFYP